MRACRSSALAVLSAAALLVVGCNDAPSTPVPPAASSAGAAKAKEAGALRMSAMGQRADLQHRALAAIAGLKPRPEDDEGEEDEDEEGGFVDDQLPGGSQGELSMAVDDTGQHIIVGFNDTRGFRVNPITVSGYIYSDDGGRTFVDGGQLPNPPTDVIGTTLLPQVFGDPDVKYMGDCTFIYTSIFFKKFSDVDAAQTLCFHRTFDCGHTWEGPFEIPSATNPNGIVVDGSPFDAADKEFIDVDRDSGRVMLSWSNFTPVAEGGVEISTTFSDNVLDDEPVWSDRVVVGGREEDGQGSIPRFGRGDDVYVAWRAFPGGLTNTIGFARSTDGGVTFEPAKDITVPFFILDQILGNDRINSSPSMAVDLGRGRNKGTIYVTYSNNDAQDGADVVVQRSTDRGKTFSAPVVVNSRPGNDRAQWFPWVAVDDNGRAFVYYYDQGIADSGDPTQVSYVFSDDGGRSWSQPRPLTDRPFHAGWGNDTGQPNLGDYNQGVTWRGELIASYAAGHLVGFADNQPQTGLSVPEPVVRRVRRSEQVAITSVDQQGVSVHELGGDRDGNIDPGELAFVNVSLRNYVTNPMNARAVRGAVALVDTATPGASVPAGVLLYSTLDPGETDDAVLPAVLRLSPGFEAGRDVELRLRVFSAGGAPTTLFATVRTGTPTATVLLAENFDSAAPGTLPAGWASAHGGGDNIVPWITRTGFCGSASNAAFHANDEDGEDPEEDGSTRFERLFSPLIVVPADADAVTLEFDVCTDTEDDPSFAVQAFDGLALRITDQTPGRTLRSVLVEAFDDGFTTGDSLHYPKHLPRSNDPAYFQDMSVWAGDSGGPQHVRLRLPGMAGSTVQLRFEYTQDFFVTCRDLRPRTECGVQVDNIVMKSVVFGR